MTFQAASTASDLTPVLGMVKGIVLSSVVLAGAVP
jgi:hypothetical protein